MMKTRTWLKAGVGVGIVALIAAAGFTFASPTAAVSPSAPTQVAAQRWGGIEMGRGDVNLATVARVLNMTESELRAELQAGKSVADVASAKGVALQAVVDAVIAEQTAALKAAVDAGRITQAQADAILANLKITLPAQLQVRPVIGLKDQGFGVKGRDRGYGGRKGNSDGGLAYGETKRSDAWKSNFDVWSGASLNAIATSLDMTVAELTAELRAGKSVADLAAAKGVSLDTVIAAIVGKQTLRLSSAVAAGRITQAEADAAIASLKEKLPELLAVKGTDFGFGRRPRR